MARPHTQESNSLESTPLTETMKNVSGCLASEHAPDILEQNTTNVHNITTTTNKK